MSSYIVPQTLLYQEFASRPEAIANPMRACVIGPNYEIVDDSINGALGIYDCSQETCYTWPNRTAGAIVDEAYTRLYIDDALLQYFYNSAASGDSIKATLCDDTINVVGDSVVKNAIRASAINWKTSGLYERSALLRTRDVQLGDTIKVSATIDDELITLWSYVAGFLSDEVDGVVAAATEDPDNESQPLDEQSSISPSITYDKDGFADNSVDIEAAGTPPNVLEACFVDGVRTDEYVLEVLAGGDYGETVIKVTSASGTDDVAELTPSDWGVATPFGDHGLSVTFNRVDPSDEFEVGMIWTLDVVFGSCDVDPVSGGEYIGPSDAVYIVEVTRGGVFGGATPPQITVSTSTGIDNSGPHDVDDLDTVVAIGAYGISIEFTSGVGSGQGLYLGDRYYIGATAPAAAGVKTLVLANRLPDALLGLDDDGNCGVIPDLNVTLYIKKDIEVPQNRTGMAPITNWSTSATEICVADGILAYDSSWVDDNGAMLALPVKGGDAWVTYRALLQRCTAAAGSIDDVSDIPEALGEIDVDNPLAFGVHMALLNSAGSDVIYIGVATDDLNGYLTALGKLVERNDVYDLVPMTFSLAIQQAVASHCFNMSAADKGRWRRLIMCQQAVDEKAVLETDEDANAVLATISDDPGTSGTQYTLVELDDPTKAEFTALGVQAGDVVRCNYTTDGFGNDSYSEYVVDAVLSDDSLRLVSGPSSAVSVASKIEIWRDLDGSVFSNEVVSNIEEFCAAVKTQGNVSSSRRVINVWPDYFTYDNELVPGYYLAAAIAGLRAGAVPQRNLTNVALQGVEAVTRSTELLTGTQLDSLAASGILIVTAEPSGTVYIRHALSTDMSDVNTREEMVTANVDSVSYYLLDEMGSFVGVTNITAATLAQIEANLISACGYLKDNSMVPTIGGQLVDFEVVSIYVHPTMLDRVVAVINITIPYPLNVLELHLVI